MSAEPQVRARRRPSLLVLLPLIAFAGLAGIFLTQLLSGHDPAAIPSALIGAPAPKTVLPPLPGSGKPGLDLTKPLTKPVLVNVFASWCGPCREEHPLLMQLSQDDRMMLVGINYKDRPEAASAFLGTLGDPYAAIGTDEAGRSTIDWGVYGVPESFLVGTDGRILWKQTGPFDAEAVQNGLYPALMKALGASKTPPLPPGNPSP